MRLTLEALDATSADLAPAWLHRWELRRAVPMPVDAMAVHEAGHAVVAASLGVRVFYATIRPRYGDGGHVSIAPLSTLTIGMALLVALAGPAASYRYFPLSRRFDEDVADVIGQFDTEQAHALLRAQHGADHIDDNVIAVELAQWRERADRAVTRHWLWIVAVAHALEYRHQLSGADIACLRTPEQKAKRDRLLTTVVNKRSKKEGNYDT